MADGAIVSGFLQGDPAAAATVEAWIVQAARSYRRRFLPEWEDLLQDIRLEIARLFRGGAFRSESSLRTYVWSVVNHSCLDRLRMRSRRPAWEELGPEDPPSGAATPLDEALRSDSWRILLRVLSQTPPECRRLWRMILDGIGYEEMSTRVGIHASTLRVKVMRCREKAVEARRKLDAESLRGKM